MLPKHGRTYLPHHIAKPSATPCRRDAWLHHAAETLSHTMSPSFSATPCNRNVRLHHVGEHLGYMKTIFLKIHHTPTKYKVAQLFPLDPIPAEQNLQPNMQRPSLNKCFPSPTGRRTCLAPNQSPPQTLPSQLKDESPPVNATSIAVQACPIIGRTF